MEHLYGSARGADAGQRSGKYVPGLFRLGAKVKFEIGIAPIASHELEPQGAAVDKAEGVAPRLTLLMMCSGPDHRLPATHLLLGHHCLRASPLNIHVATVIMYLIPALVSPLASALLDRFRVPDFRASFHICWVSTESSSSVVLSWNTGRKEQLGRGECAKGACRARWVGAQRGILLAEPPLPGARPFPGNSLISLGQP